MGVNGLIFEWSEHCVASILFADGQRKTLVGLREMEQSSRVERCEQEAGRGCREQGREWYLLCRLRHAQLGKRV